MKKFKTAIPDGGLKFFNKYLGVQLSDEIFDAIQSIFEDFKDEVEGFLLKGGTVTGSSPNAQITDSIAVLNGKILRLPATTGQTYPFYIQEATTTEENGDFEDLVARPIIDVEVAETATSAPVSGQYITVSAVGEYISGLNTKFLNDIPNSVSSSNIANSAVTSLKIASGAAEANIGYNTAESQETVSDLDDIVRAGIFQPSSSALNTPVTSDFYDLVIQNGSTGGFVSQVFIDFSTGDIHGRSKAGAAAWTAWGSINT